MNSARLACESKEENFGERFMRAVLLALAPGDGDSDDAGDVVVFGSLLRCCWLTEIFGRAPVECCCGIWDDSDDSDDGGVVKSNGDDDINVAVAVVLMLPEALVGATKTDGGPPEDRWWTDVGTLRLRKCFSENGVSSRLAGGGVASDTEHVRGGVESAVQSSGTSGQLFYVNRTNDFESAQPYNKSQIAICRGH